MGRGSRSSSRPRCSATQARRVDRRSAEAVDLARRRRRIATSAPSRVLTSTTSPVMDGRAAPPVASNFSHACELIVHSWPHALGGGQHQLGRPMDVLSVLGAVAEVHLRRSQNLDTGSTRVGQPGTTSCTRLVARAPETTPVSSPARAGGRVPAVVLRSRRHDRSSGVAGRVRAAVDASRWRSTAAASRFFVA